MVDTMTFEGHRRIQERDCYWVPVVLFCCESVGRHVYTHRPASLWYWRLIWRALTLGLWPPPPLEQRPFPLFSPPPPPWGPHFSFFFWLLSFLLVFLFAPLSCWGLEQSLDLMPSQLREPHHLQVLYSTLGIFKLHWQWVSIFAHQRGLGAGAGRLKADFFLVSLIYVYFKLCSLTLKLVLCT